MLVSSTSMNVAMVTTSAMIHGLTAGARVGLNSRRRYGGIAHCNHTLGSTDMPTRSR